MDEFDLNTILDRTSIEKKIIQILNDFQANKHDKSIKRGIYIYGKPGCGKTHFVMNVLKKYNYDIIKYDAGDIRNKSIIGTITKHNMSDKNVLSMFHKKVKNICIVMDEIDGMNSGDKGGLSSLIKIIRAKKTKKQKLEDITMNPIICISNYHVDKKIKELMKATHTFELKMPTNKQINSILTHITPNIQPNIRKNIVKYIQGDLQKLYGIVKIYNNHPDILNNKTINYVFQCKSYNEETKNIVEHIFNEKVKFEHHNEIMNETDRTIIALLWHENIIDILKDIRLKDSIPFYNDILNNICFSDYIDRITFQKQVWQFNEMTSLMKTFYNNKLLHDRFPIPTKRKEYTPNIDGVRFTKVLTKYSTEYNNMTFIQHMCQTFMLDKRDLFNYFLTLRKNETNIDRIYETCCKQYDITKLEITRLYRFIDKYTLKDVVLHT